MIHALSRPRLLATMFALTLTVGSRAQEAEHADVQIRVTPPAITLAVGAKTRLEAAVVDVGGRPVAADVVFFSRNRRAVRVERDGTVTAVQPGSYEIVVRVAREGRRGPSVTVPVTVPAPAPARIVIDGAVARIYVGTTTRARAAVLDAAGNERDDLLAPLQSKRPEVAAVDAFGQVTARSPGRCVLTADAAGLHAEMQVEVLANPVRALALQPGATDVRTGDVVHIAAQRTDADGRPLPADVPVHWSVAAQPDDDRGAGASAQIEQDGRFVAETPGLYTVVAACGDVIARTSIRARPRGVQQRIEVIGRGEVLDVHTSDLWVWEGVDGRDYAVTGTWGANGDAHFWDVTDPTHIERIATVTVDARTVNDVKVSEDGRICVLSREGASNRKNGIVVVDVSNPRAPVLLSTFTDELTGGVHNVFVSGKHVYALSAGRRYDVIDIEDPAVPHRVSSFELDTPGHAIHDVWVADGIAVSSNWRDGLQLVDVGNGIAGGAPDKPIRFASYAYPSGWNHAAFPYRNAQTGRFYVIAGDEAFPFGLHTEDKPTYPRGWMHFVDFTDLEHPREVARYLVPEAGTHNLWVEGDVLYAAYYNGGVRVVDISGELMGDLYRQGREIAWFIPTDHRGVIPNAAMTWGPQPHKGTIFFSDWNSGLWAAKLVAEDK